MNSYVWPIRARLEIRERLSDIWLKVGSLWRASYLCLGTKTGRVTGTTDRDNSLREVIDLQHSLANLYPLLTQASSELNLMPFPVFEYGALICQTEDLLIALHTLLVAPK